MGWGKPEIAIRTDTSYWQLSSRWYVARDCITIGAGNNRPWRSAERGGEGEGRNDPRLIRIRGKLFEFSIDGSA